VLISGAIAVALALSVAAAAGGLLLRGHEPQAAPGESPPRKPFRTNDVIERACALRDDYLARIWRGTDEQRSGDLLLVSREPNFAGSFQLTSHSGPWDYLQRVPLVLYGPRRIKAAGKPLTDAVDVTDIYPTVGRLLRVDLPKRDGAVLSEALRARPGQPKLVMVVVWDGAGRTTLQRWPQSWPTVRKLQRDGTSYQDAVVGSAPSTTPAIHSSIGTGSYPRSHLVTGNYIRRRSGEVVPVFGRGRPRELELSTFADEIDKALHNEPLVGMLGWLDWHLGMLGHGLATRGGDADHVARLDYTDRVTITANEDLYSTPSYLLRAGNVHERILELDREDGMLDGRWMGQTVTMKGRDGTWMTASNPAWARYQTDLVLAMLEREGYGQDDVPDLFLTNFKMTDLAAHRWTIDSERVGAVLEAQDAAIARIISFLDNRVRDYVLILTADHGATPSPSNTGAWPISQNEVVEDIDQHFGIPEGSSLVQETALFDVYLDHDKMEQLNITASDIAEFMNGLTIRDNAGSATLPQGYSQRAEEHIYSAVIPKARLAEIMGRTCSRD
jgi:hypothetical protein